TAAESWLRGNPHRLHLGLIGLWGGPTSANEAQLEHVEQDLDLWSGVIDSRFVLAGVPYKVVTVAHPTRDAVAVSIEGPASSPVGIRLRFPYGSDAWANAADWSRPDAHRTTITPAAAGWRL